ncbi:MAG: hypothetical protein IIA45_01035 [Bacteroidetes bacterium]|nr:hypothetical protein [Bacteroidota bacterium]
MIRNKTLFILGAGASKPYDYPSGRGLKKLVLQNTSKQMGKNNHDLYDWLSIDPKKVIEFNKKLSTGPYGTVDELLIKQKEFKDVGTTAIATVLTTLENYDRFTHDDDNWYLHLFQRMTIDAPTLDDFYDNNVNFITFNYDRSLEHYLYTSLAEMYPEDSEMVVDALKSIDIIHFHGCLCDLPFQNPSGFKYEPKFNFNKISAASENIKFPSLEKADKKLKHRIDQLIFTSKIICFLGFGYHELNMRELSFFDFGAVDQQIIGSALGFLKGDRERVNEKATFSIKFGDENHENERFLRENLTLT